jgi:hypothetical protein
MLMGLSTASVIGSVIASLAAALAAFLGLVPSVTADRTIRISAFGFACAASVLFGLAIRTNLLGWAPSVKSEVHLWTDAGYSPEEARSLVAYKLMGVRPANREVSPPPPPSPDSLVLFSGKTELCSAIARLPPLEVLKVLKGPSGGPMGGAVVAAAESVPESERADAIRAFSRSLCGA